MSKENENESEQAVVAKQKSDILESDFFTTLGGTGFELQTSEFEVIPFIKICQKMSRAYDQTRPEYIEGLELGQFYNTATGEIYGDSINLSFLQMTPKIILMEGNTKVVGFKTWEEYKQALKVPGMLRPGKYKERVLEDVRGVSWVECLEYMVVNMDKVEDGIAIFSVTSAGIKCGKDLNSKSREACKTSTKFPNGLPRYSHVWHITVADDVKDGNPYWFPYVDENRGLIPNRNNNFTYIKKFFDASQDYINSGVNFQSTNSPEEEGQY